MQIKTRQNGPHITATIHIPSKLHQELKILAAKRNLHLQNLVAQVLWAEINK